MRNYAMSKTLVMTMEFCWMFSAGKKTALTSAGKQSPGDHLLLGGAGPPHLRLLPLPLLVGLGGGEHGLGHGLREALGGGPPQARTHGRLQELLFGLQFLDISVHLLLQNARHFYTSFCCMEHGLLNLIRPDSRSKQPKNKRWPFLI